MGSLYYLEVLRQVHPAIDKAIMNDSNFFIFGEFDAMYVEHLKECKQISDLKQKFEDRHEGPVKQSNTVNSLTPGNKQDLQGTGHEYKRSIDGFLTTDRYPVFLYSDNDHESGIFNRDGEMAVQPLAVTLFQMDKEKILNDNLSELIKNCKCAISDIVNKPDVFCDRSNCPGADRCLIDCDIFWNIGQADLVTVFRAKRLRCIAKLIMTIRRKSAIGDAPILSTSTYCGFPNTTQWRSNINKWLVKERIDISNDGKRVYPFNFLLQYKVLAGEHAMEDKNLTFAFGNWDYQEYIANNGFEQPKRVEKLLKEAILSNLSGDEKSKQWYHSSYSVPSYAYPEAFVSNGNTEGDVHYFYDKIKEQLAEIRIVKSKLYNGFSGYVNKILMLEGVYAGKDHIDDVVRAIKSFRKTICGLLGFLARLYIGRFEQDQLKYILPVFINLNKIIKNYSRGINAGIKEKMINDKDIRKNVENDIEEFIRDTGDLITRLQQIYIVIAFSPHTFLETYGSSMRSLSAASKLMGAYQGLIKYIKINFPISVENRITENHCTLVIPYRRTNPSNRLLYANTYPDTRISLICVDYSKMFNKNAVFMLLHECAHVYSNRQRELRFSYFCNALTQDVLYSVLGEFISTPVDKFIGLVTETTEDEINHKSSKRLFFDNELEKHFNFIIRYNVYVFLLKNCSSITNKFKIEYKNDLRKSSIFAYYMSSVNKWLRKEMYYLYSDKKYIDNFSKSLREIMVNIASKIKNAILEGNGGNIREAIRLEELYKREDCYEELSKDLTSRINNRLDDSENFSLLSELFTDVYSDLFPIIILNVDDLSKYIEVLYEFAGARVQEWLLGSHVFLLRIMTIAEVMGWNVKKKVTVNDDSILGTLLYKKEIPTEIADEAINSWEWLYNLPYRRPVIKYARHCKKSLLDIVSSLEGDRVLTAIRELWKDGQSTDVVPHIYTLWRYLLETDAKESGGC